MKRVLVTGAAGFIGSHVVEALLAQGHRVVALDNFDAFYPRWVKQQNVAVSLQNPLCTFAEADISQPGAFSNQLAGAFDVIVHLAAKAGVRPSIADPLGYQLVNVGGTQNILELARERGVGQVVFASSSSVYGINPRVPWSEDDHVLRPISPYASTKVSGELLGHVYAHLYGIRFIALRFFTVYGPRQRPDLAIHKFARLMLDGRAVPIYGDGNTRRDYTYVGDVVAGVLSAMTYERSLYEVINLGNNNTVSLSTLVAVLASELGVTPRLERLAEQPGDVPQTWARIDKAKDLLGYSPQTPFEKGIRSFVEWLQAAPGPVRTVS